MEAGVGGGKAEHVVALGHGFHLLHDLFELGQMGGVVLAAADGAGAGGGLQRDADFDQLVDALGVTGVSRMPL
ncbi:MAG: hypothetical protein U1F00_18810 [Rhodoferax sp.]